MRYQFSAREKLLARIYLALVAVVGAVAGAYIFEHRARLFPEADTVVIYGRDACGITSALRDYLAQQGVAYEYGNVDDGYWVNEEMWHVHHRMQGADSQRARFPIVRINGHILERPDEERVLALYQQARAASPQ